MFNLVLDNGAVWSATPENPFLYCGEFFDNETGLIYLRVRYYSPDIQRFISEDPIKDGINWYAYCANNPIMFVDSMGLEYESTAQQILESVKLSEYDEALYQKALEQDGEEAATKFLQGIVASKIEFINAGPTEYAKKIRAHKKTMAWRSKYDENAEANDDFDYTFGGAYKMPSMAVISEDYSVDSDPLGINIYETWSTEVYFDRIDGEAVQYYESLNEKRTAADQQISTLINLFLGALGLTGLKEGIACALIGLFFNEFSVSSLFTGNGEFFCTEGNTLQISYQQITTYDYFTSSYSVTRIMYYNIVDIEGNTKKNGRKIVNMPLWQ